MALGMAIALRIQGKHNRCYALVSDGECNEGSIWEATMLAAAQKVERLTVIVDYNKWQATGRSQEIMALEPLKAKWEAFGWHAQQIDGHNLEAISCALKEARSGNHKTKRNYCRHYKRERVSFMEDDNNWHYRTPNESELKAAITEIEEARE